MKRVVFEVVHWITRLCVKGFVTFDCHRHFWSTACRIALVARRTAPFSPTVTKMLVLTSKLCMHSSVHFILRWQFTVTMNKTLLASTFICNFMFVAALRVIIVQIFFFFWEAKSSLSWYIRGCAIYVQVRYLILCIAGYLEQCREDCLFVLLLDTEDTLENYWHDSFNSHGQQKLCTMSKKAVK